MNSRKRKKRKEKENQKQIKKVENDRIIIEEEEYDLNLERVIHREFLFGKIILEKVIGSICSTLGEYIPTEEEVEAVATMHYGFQHYVSEYMEGLEPSVQDLYIETINLWGGLYIVGDNIYYSKVHNI